MKHKNPSLSLWGIPITKEAIWMGSKRRKKMVKVIFSKEEKQQMREAGMNPTLQRIGYEENLGGNLREDIGNALDLKEGLRSGRMRPASKQLK
jgi:hypothetical protein